MYKLGYILLQLALTPLLSVALAARFLLEDTRRLLAPASPTVAAAIRLTQRKADQSLRLFGASFAQNMKRVLNYTSIRFAAQKYETANLLYT